MIKANVRLKLRVRKVRDGSPSIDHWHQRHVGEVFDVLHLERGIPDIYTVSTEHLIDEPLFVRPIAFVPSEAAEIIDVPDDESDTIS
jgi:hypothetical protein